MSTSLRVRDAAVFMLLLPTFLILASGCRPASSTKDSEPGPPAAPVEIDAERLPPLGEDMLSLLGGDLLIAAPEGWRPAPRTDSHSIRFYNPSGRQGYPLILVTWEETSLAEKLTEENALDLAESFVQSEGAEVATIIGDNNVALLWKENQGTDSKRPGAVVERMVAAVIAQEQLYRLEYRNWQDEVANEQYSDREFLLAVADGMQFPLEPQSDEPTGDSDTQEPGTDSEEANVTDPPEEVEPGETTGTPPTEPDETEPEPTEPEPTEPEATEPEPTEPEATEPEPTEPEPTEPEPTEPEPTEPEPTEPEATETPDEDDDDVGTDLDSILDRLNRP